MAQRLLRKYYGTSLHPYTVFERRVSTLVETGRVSALMDAGCGRDMPVLRKFVGRVDRLVGVELEHFSDVPDGVEIHEGDLSRLPLDDECLDVIISRSVFEHLTDPASVYSELFRVLRPGGEVLFLTANMWDYATIVSRLVPNRFHARIVKLVEGRDEEDTFPTAYRTNTRRAVVRLAAQAGFEVESFEYLTQYPNYLMFNGVAFLAGVAYERVISRFEALRYLRPWILVSLRKPRGR